MILQFNYAINTTKHLSGHNKKNAGVWICDLGRKELYLPWLDESSQSLESMWEVTT